MSLAPLHCLTLRNFSLRTAKHFVYGAVVSVYIIVIVRLVCDIASNTALALGPRPVFEPYYTLSTL